MKYLAVIASLIMFSVTSIAGHHEGEEGLKLEKRQADSVMTVTNVDLGDKTFNSSFCFFNLCFINARLYKY